VQRKLAELKVWRKLAFTSFSTIAGKSRGDIYVVSATVSKRITDDRVNAMAPAWSPDGKRIAFGFVRDDRYEMYTVNADGSEWKKLTVVDRHDDVRGMGFPSWSPDGSKIAFELQRDEPVIAKAVGEDDVQIFEPTIAVMNSDGTGFATLGNGHWPRWSPDGTEVLFHSAGEKSFVVGVGPFPTMGIYTMSPNGRDVRRLTDQETDAMFGSWSPDGKQIVFASNRDYQPHNVANLEIYLMSADGADLRRLTYSKGPKNCPSWSPDGEWIAFHQADDHGRSSLWLIKPDGSNLTRLTGEQHDVGFPAWCPAEKDR